MDFNWIGSTIIQNILLFLTLIFAVSIGIKQNQINENVEKTAIRPVILRSNVIPDWGSLKNGNINGELFVFKVSRNIATDIRGYIIIDHKKFDFQFGYSVGATTNDGRVNGILTDTSIMGWVEQGGFLLAKFNPRSSVNTDLPNQIFLTYKDIDGNPYYTKENNDFIQVSSKL